SLSLPPEPVYLDADAVRLDQVFGNLLNNASKFTPKGGHIWLKATVTRGERTEIVVRVRDDGAGIAPEVLPRVFDVFMEADRSRARTEGGLGIGLTLAHRLVELHGGSIEAHSAGLGQGSEFVVHLPIMSTSATRAAQEAPPKERAKHATMGRRILVVDDNVD